MINPVLKTEIRRRFRPQKLTLALISQLAIIGIIFWLTMMAKLGRGITSLMIAETCWVILVSPILCNRISPPKDLLTAPLKLRSIMFGKVIGSLSYPILIILISFVSTTIAIYVSVKNPSLAVIIKLVQVHLLLTAISTFFGCLTILLSQLFRANYPFSAHISYLIAALSVSSFYLSKFIIDYFSDPSRFISILLHLNPIVAVSSTLGFDLLRSRYIYSLSTITMYRFTYPSWHSTFLLYIALSSCMFGLGLLGLRIRRC